MTHDEIREMLLRIETYCPNATCGDAIPNLTGVAYTKRRMIFSRFTWGDYDNAIYVCPVCGMKKGFKKAFLENGWDEFAP